MISDSDFWNHITGKGFSFFSGVPCSILKGVLTEAAHNLSVEYVPAVRENVALGIASGACLAGRKSGILIQNSGLGNIINALTSFNLIYKVPVLMFITWRGFEGKDAPEHLIMGEKTLVLLEELGIPTVVLSSNFENDIDGIIYEMNEELIPAAVILKKGIVE